MPLLAIQIWVPLWDQEFHQNTCHNLPFGIPIIQKLGGSSFWAKVNVFAFLLDHLPTVQLLQHCKNKQNNTYNTWSQWKNLTIPSILSNLSFGILSVVSRPEDKSTLIFLSGCHTDGCDNLFDVFQLEEFPLSKGFFSMGKLLLPRTKNPCSLCFPLQENWEKSKKVGNIRRF